MITNNAEYQSINGAFSAPCTDPLNSQPNLDNSMQWDPNAEYNQDDPVDNSFLQANLTRDLLECQTAKTSKDMQLVDLLKQFPYLIAQALNWAYFAELDLAIMRPLVHGVDNGGDEQIAAEALKSAKGACYQLAIAQTYLERALIQFDPKLNPAAYMDSKAGPLLKCCALNLNYTPQALNNLQKELEIRAYFKENFKSISTLCSVEGFIPSIKFDNLLALKDWIDTNLTDAQRVVGRFAHLDRVDKDE